MRQLVDVKNADPFCKVGMPILGIFTVGHVMLGVVLAFKILNFNYKRETLSAAIQYQNSKFLIYTRV